MTPFAASTVGLKAHQAAGMAAMGPAASSGGLLSSIMGGIGSFAMPAMGIASMFGGSDMFGSGSGPDYSTAANYDYSTVIQTPSTGPFNVGGSRNGLVILGGILILIIILSRGK